MSVFTKTYKRWENIPEFNTVDRSMLGISGLLIILLKDYFSHNSTLFKYDQNPIESKVLIEIQKEWNPTNCENYPGIFIKRKSWVPRMEGRVSGDYRSLLTEDPYSYDFWVPITANYSIIVTGKVSGEVEVLLNEIFLYLTIFSEPIKTHLGFGKFDIVGVSETDILKIDKDFYSGEISLVLSFDFTWRLTLEKPKLNRITINERV